MRMICAAVSALLAIRRVDRDTGQGVDTELQARDARSRFTRNRRITVLRFVTSCYYFSPNPEDPWNPFPTLLISWPIRSTAV